MTNNTAKIIFALSLILIFSLPQTCYADNFFKKIFSSDKHTEKSRNLNVKIPEGLYDLSLEENLNILSSGKYSEELKEHQKNQALALMKMGYNIEIMRNGEIIIVSIPADDLFAPMESDLSDAASGKLSIFSKFVKVPDLYRLMMVMNTDDTGSDEYKQSVTQKRVDAVFNWFKDNNTNTDYIIPYAMSDENPIVMNNSYENRHKNRRLEIYLVPGEEMIKSLKHKTNKNLKIIK